MKFNIFCHNKHQCSTKNVPSNTQVNKISFIAKIKMAYYSKFRTIHPDTNYVLANSGISSPSPNLAFTI